MRGKRRKLISKTLLELGVPDNWKATMKSTKRAWMRRNPRGTSPDTGTRHDRIGTFDGSRFKGFRTSRNRTRPQTWNAPAVLGGLIKSLNSLRSSTRVIAGRYMTAISRLDGALRQRIAANPGAFFASVPYHPKNPDMEIQRFFYPERYPRRNRTVFKGRSTGITAMVRSIVGL
jgi:hypothetical protein